MIHQYAPQTEKVFFLVDDPTCVINHAAHKHPVNPPVSKKPLDMQESVKLNKFGEQNEKLHFQMANL